MQHRSLTVIESWIRDGLLQVIYGPAATGKTHLALTFAEIAARVHGKSCIIASEPGTALLLREAPPKGGVLAAYATTPEELLSFTLRCTVRGAYTVIDTINAFCDPTDVESYRYVSMTSALLRSSRRGGAAFAQVRGEPYYPACWKAIIPWAEVVGETSRDGGRFVLRILKPIEALVTFRLTEGRAVWA